MLACAAFLIASLPARGSVPQSDRDEVSRALLLVAAALVAHVLTMALLGASLAPAPLPFLADLPVWAFLGGLVWRRALDAHFAGRAHVAVPAAVAGALVLCDTLDSSFVSLPAAAALLAVWLVLTGPTAGSPRKAALMSALLFLALLLLPPRADVAAALNPARLISWGLFEGVLGCSTDGSYLLTKARPALLWPRCSGAEHGRSLSVPGGLPLSRSPDGQWTLWSTSLCAPGGSAGRPRLLVVARGAPWAVLDCNADRLYSVAWLPRRPGIVLVRLLAWSDSAPDTTSLVALDLAGRTGWTVASRLPLTGVDFIDVPSRDGDRVLLSKSTCDGELSQLSVVPIGGGPARSTRVVPAGEVLGLGPGDEVLLRPRRGAPSPAERPVLEALDSAGATVGLLQSSGALTVHGLSPDRTRLVGSLWTPAGGPGDVVLVGLPGCRIIARQRLVDSWVAATAWSADSSKAALSLRRSSGGCWIALLERSGATHGYNGPSPWHPDGPWLHAKGAHPAKECVDDIPLLAFTDPAHLVVVAEKGGPHLVELETGRSTPLRWGALPSRGGWLW